MRRYERGFVIGNGTSRQDFDLRCLNGQLTIGCNRIHEDYAPTYIVALDTHMVNKLRPMTKARRLPWQLITREALDNEFWITCNGRKTIPVKSINKGFINNSGILATAYMAQVLEVPLIYLIGIDFFSPIEGKRNNVYGYNCRRSSALHNVWNHIPECSPDTRFIRVGPIPEHDADFFENKLQGYEFISYEDLPV